MNIAHRHKIILKELEKGYVTVQGLSKILGGIRGYNKKDLKELESRRLLLRKPR
ncbi:MAG: hypothetical protein R2727_08060 [Bacteroidales bacterium]